jgi:hypothetical protein
MARIAAAMASSCARSSGANIGLAGAEGARSSRSAASGACQALADTGTKSAAATNALLRHLDVNTVVFITNS